MVGSLPEGVALVAIVSGGLLILIFSDRLNEDQTEKAMSIIHSKIPAATVILEEELEDE